MLPKNVVIIGNAPNIETIPPFNRLNFTFGQRMEGSSRMSNPVRHEEHTSVGRLGVSFVICGNIIKAAGLRNPRINIQGWSFSGVFIQKFEKKGGITLNIIGYGRYIEWRNPRPFVEYSGFPHFQKRENDGNKGGKLANLEYKFTHYFPTGFSLFLVIAGFICWGWFVWAVSNGRDDWRILLALCLGICLYGWGCLRFLNLLYFGHF